MQINKKILTAEIAMMKRRVIQHYDLSFFVMTKQSRVVQDVQIMDSNIALPNYLKK